MKKQNIQTTLLILCLLAIIGNAIFQHGTRIEATTTDLMLLYKRTWGNEADIQDGMVKNISFDGKNICTQGLRTQAGTAYFRFSRCNFTNTEDTGGSYKEASYL